MKHIFKKNQIIITVLAVMIAVAGYLNYSGAKLGIGVSPASTDEDSVSGNPGSDGETGQDSAWIDIESLDEDFATADLSAEESGDQASVEGAEPGKDTPGEAVLTSISGSSDFAAAAKLSREQVRAKNKETLLEVINNGNIAEEQKQDAINSMNQMADLAEKEAAAELLLESKGFCNAVVSITDGTADVVIGLSQIDDAQRAQIEDIVKRKTEIAGENIVITPMAETDVKSQE